MAQGVHVDLDPALVGPAVGPAERPDWRTTLGGALGRDDVEIVVLDLCVSPSGGGEGGALRRRRRWRCQHVRHQARVDAALVEEHAHLLGHDGHAEERAVCGAA